MKLPDADLLVGQREKITEYLLNAAHPDNGGKAAFFVAIGFSSNDWETFAAALRKLAETGEVIKTVETFHGLKYIVEGTIETPAGKRPTVRTVWITDRGLDGARLVTAYPQRQ